MLQKVPKKANTYKSQYSLSGGTVASNFGGQGRFCGGRGVNVGLEGLQGEPVERGKEGKAHLGQEAFPPVGEKAGRMLSVLGESWRGTVWTRWGGQDSEPRLTERRV